MAKVVIEGDESEFVVLSKVRTGLKREFQFALNTQNEIAGSLSRTRVRKTPPTESTELSELPATKKMKRPVGRPRKKQSLMSHNNIQAVESEDEPQSDVVDVMSDEESNRQHIVESQRRENVNGNGSESDSVVENGGSDDVVLKNKKVKVPTKLKELLETGLLEGLSVTYIRGFKVILNV